jgi:hypothetical protein
MVTPLGFLEDDGLPVLEGARTLQVARARA